MPDDDIVKVVVPRFLEDTYLADNDDARRAVQSGGFDTALDHYLRHGNDAGREPVLRRESLTLAGTVERCFVSESGYFLVLGWLADEGCGQPRCRLHGGDFSIEVPPAAILRHARTDVEHAVGEGAYDYGFLLFGRSPSRMLLKQPLLVDIGTDTANLEARTTPTVVSDKRLLDTMLTRSAVHEAHAGKEATLHAFLAGSAGASMIALFRGHVATHTAGHYVERFRPRRVERSFVTVLFGSTEAAMVQPVLFHRSGIDFGESIYVCNSPEDAGTALRLGRLMADLYDVAITIVVMSDNVGFGVANNVAISHAAGRSIYLINPDVYPALKHVSVLSQTLAQRDLGADLWGGLLFYDDNTLMHSGMFLEQDVFFRGFPQ